MQAAPPTPQRTVCPIHNRPIDPRLSRGCALCARDRLARREGERLPQWSTVMALLVAGVGVLAVVIPIWRAVRPVLFGTPEVKAEAGTRGGQALGACADPIGRAPMTAELGEARARACSRACDEREGAGCWRLAGLCAPAARDRFPRLPADVCPDDAQTLISRGCTKGDPVACQLGKDALRAESLWKACGGGQGRPCAELAALCASHAASLETPEPLAGLAFLSLPAAAEPCAVGEADLYDRACAGGDATSCAKSGKPEGARQTSQLELGCDRGDRGACQALAAEPGPPGRAAALLAYTADLDACAAGARGPCPPLSWRMRVGDAEKKAVQKDALESEQGCAKGEINACWRAAAAYETGEGVGQDPQRASSLNARALSLLGSSCADQDGGSCAPPEVLRALKDCNEGRGARCLEVAAANSAASAVLRPRGLRLLSEGCDRGEGDSCRALVADPATTPERRAAAAQKGCAGGDAESCRVAGQQLEAGLGGARDKIAAERAYRKAADLFARGCERGERSSCEAAAQLYDDGKGVARDEERARGLRASGPR